MQTINIPFVEEVFKLYGLSKYMSSPTRRVWKTGKSSNHITIYTYSPLYQSRLEVEINGRAVYENLLEDMSEDDVLTALEVYHAERIN